MTIMAKNTVSTEYTGNTSFEPNNNRTYFFIVMTSGVGTIAFGGGTGEIPLEEGFHYQPGVTPTGQINITTAGTYVVHQG
jgi:hypothetical protein